jgi:methionyl-tRNA formyltransferase
VNRTRLVFFGTPDPAVPALFALASHFDVGLVLTQPDRPRGRSSQPVAPPVKTAAHRLGIPVAQPERSVDIAPVLRAHGPFTLGVLVAYGMLIRPEALETPAHGILNAHFSLLPRWRGAAPVQRAMMAGDERTGVSMMVVEQGLDTGPVVSTWSTAIGASETGGSLSARLAAGAATLTADLVGPYVAGRVVATPQPDGATQATKLSAADRPVDWTWATGRVVSHILALSPRPGATAAHGDVILRLVRARPADLELDPGRFALLSGRLLVGTGDGAIELLRVHPAGRTEMAGPDWARGLGLGSGVLT